MKRSLCILFGLVVAGCSSSHVDSGAVTGAGGGGGATVDHGVDLGVAVDPPASGDSDGDGGSTEDGGGGDMGVTPTNGSAPCTVPAYLTTQKLPDGWASQGGGTTGGGSAKPVLVTTLADLQTAVAGTTPAVVYLKGVLPQGTITIGSNKTIIGCSGAATMSGHVQMTGSVNVIIRNLAVVGYNCAPPDIDVTKGGQCQNGLDALTVEKDATHLWFDHLAISDGSDGNLDITHASDYITISYTKIFYTNARLDPNDTGAAGHRFSDLIGHSDDNATEDTGHLRITFSHDWWADFVVERQPRVRFGHVHIYNSLWTATGNHYGIGVGVGANILDENNVFQSTATPVDTTDYVDATIAPSYIKSVGNLYTTTSGDPVVDLTPGSVFVPPYPYTPAAAANVATDVKTNAGPH